MTKQSISLRVRLVIAFGTVAVAGAVSGGASVLGLQAVNQHAMTLYEKHLLGLSAIKEAEIDLIQVARYRAQYARASDAAARDKFRALFEKYLAATADSLAKAVPTLVTERDQSALRQVQANLEVYMPHGRAFLDAVAKTEPPVVSTELNDLNQTAIDTFQPVTNGLSELAAHKEEVGASAAQSIGDTYSNVRWLVVLASVMTVGLAAVAGRATGQAPGSPAGWRAGGCRPHCTPGRRGRLERACRGPPWRLVERAGCDEGDAGSTLHPGRWHPRLGGQHRHGLQPDRLGQRRPLAPHGAASLEAATDGVDDGGAEQHGGPQRGYGKAGRIDGDCGE